MGSHDMSSKVSRSKALLIVVSIIILVQLVFLFRWQIVKYRYFAEMISNRVYANKEYGIRGKITSSDGTILAYTDIAYDVYIFLPKLIEIENRNPKTQSRDEFITKVSAILNVSDISIKDLLDNKSSNNILLAKQISTQTKENLTNSITTQGYKLTGFDFIRNDKRVYPNDTLGSNLIGTLNNSGNPVFGIESSFNGDLKPQDGVNFSKLDAKGNPILSQDINDLEKSDGFDIKLTINAQIQHTVENKLKEGVEKYKAESGEAVIIDSSTGDIIAIAQYPHYIPNLPNQTGLFKLNPVTDTYEPGSVGKIFTLVAGIDSGKVNKDTLLLKGHSGTILVKDQYSTFRVGVFGKVPRNNITVENMIFYSDNIGAYFLAKLVGEESLKKYLGAFGIGEKTDVQIPGESQSLANLNKSWYDLDLWSNSFGQSYSMTALQVTSAVASLGNDCSLLRPQIVKTIEKNGINAKTSLPYKIRQICSSQAQKDINSIMHENFVNYTKQPEVVKYATILNSYNLAGKTGTAELRDSDSQNYDEGNVNATFIGYDITPNSHFTMLVKLTKPQLPIANSSSHNAFPLWVEIFNDIKDMLSIKKIN